MTDPYATLGLTRSATPEEIKAAYRKLVRVSHPDLHPDDRKAEAKFKAISAAHDLLSDPATRARFDAGEIDATGAEKPRRRHPGFNPFGPQGFPMPGRDLSFALEVGFLEAVRGERTKITLPEVGEVELQIPRGAYDGMTLRLKSKGAPGPTGAIGDALVTLSVRPHPHFRREGDDIHLTLPVTIDEAILGAKVSVPTIDGTVSVTIPAGASSGRVLRLRGRGVAGRTVGDQLMELRIMAPPVVDEGLRSFLQGWRAAHGYDPRKGLEDETA